MDAGPFDPRTPAWRRRIVYGNEEIVLGLEQTLDGGQHGGGLVFVAASGGSDVTVGLLYSWVMPTARNQEVTVRRPRAKRTPSREREAACDLGMKSEREGEKRADNRAGKYNKDMAGSLAWGVEMNHHRVQGAGSRLALDR